MACPSSGTITIQDLVDEFGGSTPHSLSEYYRNGANVPGNNTNVPESGAIQLDDFYGAVNEIQYTISTDTPNLNLETAFTTSNWTSTVPKRLIINATKSVYGTGNNAAITAPDGMLGTLIIDNNGNIYGAAGAGGAGGAAGGAGGDAISLHANITTGVTINNASGANIQGGGGGGGGAATGGAGGSGGNGTKTGCQQINQYCFGLYGMMFEPQYYAWCSPGGAGGAGGTGGAGGAGATYQSLTGTAGSAGVAGAAGANGTGATTCPTPAPCSDGGKSGTGGGGGAGGTGGTGGTGGNIGLSGADGGAGTAGASGSNGSYSGHTNCCGSYRPCTAFSLLKTYQNWAPFYNAPGGAGGSAPTDHGAGGLAGYYLLDPGTAVTMNNSGTLTGRS